MPAAHNHTKLKAATMIGVEVRNENVEKALKVFNRRVRKAGVLREYKNNMFYTKPSEERREERKRAEKKAKEHARNSRFN